jgi:hypothetical protein
MHELHGAGQMVVSTSQAADDQVLGAIALGDLGQAVGQGDCWPVGLVVMSQ